MKKRISVMLVVILLLFSCEPGKINMFSLEQDKKLGAEFDAEIVKNPGDFPILSRVYHPEAYAHIERIRDAVLTSDDLDCVDDFVWKVTIIDNDDVLNAFAVPGGYLYFYTGLIKFLDNEAEFAGVMAHEIAHVDKRHTTIRMTEYYGIQILLSVILGEETSVLTDAVVDLAYGLGALKFSRDNEYEADEYAVYYIADAGYAPKAVGGFFEKLKGQDRSFEFLSTHPDPGNRVEAIESVWNSIGAPDGVLNEESYAAFKASL